MDADMGLTPAINGSDHARDRISVVVALFVAPCDRGVRHLPPDDRTERLNQSRPSLRGNPVLGATPGVWK